MPVYIHVGPQVSILSVVQCIPVIYRRWCLHYLSRHFIGNHTKYMRTFHGTTVVTSKCAVDARNLRNSIFLKNDEMQPLKQTNQNTQCAHFELFRST